MRRALGIRLWCAATLTATLGPAGCGGELTPSSGGHRAAGSTSPVPDTGTATPGPTGTATQPDAQPTSPTPSTSSPGPAPSVPSDVEGRSFDIGTIERVHSEQGVDVIVLDRWTVYGLSDSALAADGVDLTPHTEARFHNVNNVDTYRVPVAPDATFMLQECVAPNEPPEVSDSTLAELAELGAPQNVVLLVLDEQGRAVEASNDPAC